MNQFVIDQETKVKIDRWLEKYPANRKRSAVTPVLLIVQEKNQGWLSLAAMNAVATYLDLNPIVVYEVATFFDMFETQPVGKHKIKVCTNLSCMLRGSDEIVSCLKDRLGICLGETSADGKFTLRESECLAACGGAPMCQVNDRDYYEDLTPKKMLQIVTELEKEVDYG